jgi:hypothetical protein
LIRARTLNQEVRKSQRKKLKNLNGYARFTWYSPYNLEELATKLKESFTIVKSPAKKKKEPWNLTARVWSFQDDVREEIEVKADTLFASLSPFRAILFQKEKAPFTKKDMELRETVLALYPRSTATPVPFRFGEKEPKFEKEPS